VHDYFDILGVSRDAPAQEIRRACARRACAGHPDFLDADASGLRPRVDDPRGDYRHLADVAVDFVAMSDIAARMQAAFFRRPAR
jgi:curved DNA-binding protein CbpA